MTEYENKSQVVTKSNRPQIQEYENGKWVSVNVDANTYYYLLEIKNRLDEMKIKVSRNDIIKRLLELGTENLCLVTVLKNPLALWSKSVEEELL